MKKTYRLSTKTKISREKDKTIQTQAYSNMKDEIRVNDNDKAIYLQNNTVLSSINASTAKGINKTFFIMKDHASILSSKN